MGTDLTATAQGNSTARQAVASKALRADRSGRLRRFRRFLASSLFSTNVDFSKITAYNDAKGLLDTRSYYILRAGGDTAKGLAEFASAQGCHFARRECFEDLWEHGRRFLYGAVNAGGTGVESFGPICLAVPDPESQELDALAVFPEDTLQRYTHPAGGVDEPRAQQEATAWGDRAYLAVIERGADAKTTPEPNWSRVLWRNDGYLEVVLAGPLPLEAVREARLSAALRKRLEDLRATWLVGGPLTRVEENEVAAYDALHRWRHRYGTTINDLP